MYWQYAFADGQGASRAVKLAGSSRLLKKTHMLRCAQSSCSNVLAKYACARRFFARLASEIFLSSLQTEFFSNLLDYLRLKISFQIFSYLENSRYSFSAKG